LLQVVEEELKEEKKEKEKLSLLAEVCRAALRASVVMSVMLQANLEGLNTLFATMVHEDPEQIKLKPLPGFLKIITEYKVPMLIKLSVCFKAHIACFASQVMFEKTTIELTEELLKVHQEKQTEHKDFIQYRDTVRSSLIACVCSSAGRQALSLMEKKSIAKIQAFEALKKREFKLWQESIAQDRPDKFVLFLAGKRFAWYLIAVSCFVQVYHGQSCRGRARTEPPALRPRNAAGAQAVFPCMQCLLANGRSSKWPTCSRSSKSGTSSTSRTTSCGCVRLVLCTCLASLAAAAA
jgi:hypothetical protein